MTTTTARRTIVLGPEGNLSVADETLSRQAEKMSLKEGRLGMDTAENPQREMQTSETDKPEMDETAHNDEGMAPGETNEGEINNLDTQGRGMHPALLKNLPSNERDLNATEASIYSEQNDLPDGEQAMSGHDNVDEEFRGHALGPNDDSKMALGSALATDPAEMNESREVQGMEEDHPNGDAMSTRTGATTRTGITNRTGVTSRTGATRPTMRDEPSRSYLNTKAMPIVTTYETYEQDPATDNASIKTTPVDKHKSVAGSTKAPTVKRGSVDEGSLRAPTVTRLPTSKPASVKAPSTKAATIKRPPSVAASVRNRDSTDDGGVAGAASGTGLGQVLTPQRQRELQQRNNVQPNNVHPLGPAGHSRTSLNDQGHVARDRNTTFDEPERAASPRPMSPFGHRPAPNLMSVAEDGRESRFDQRDRGGGMLNRNGTVISRANTMGRNGTLSRAQNGGTVGSRRGAFGRGAGASIGTQPEEVLGRDDIHTRAELTERILDDSTLRRLSNLEKKDASRLAKIIKSEGKAETAAVKGSIKELERISRLQKEAAHAERKSQLRLSKWTTKEHKARLRFLKEKERYEKVEGDLRNAENDYEERRDHAAGLTAQVADLMQQCDDMRGQKAADDREREVKLLAIKNPGHS